jgi:hypothetical protein
MEGRQFDGFFMGFVFLFGAGGQAPCGAICAAYGGRQADIVRATQGVWRPIGRHSRAQIRAYPRCVALPRNAPFYGALPQTPPGLLPRTPPKGLSPFGIPQYLGVFRSQNNS